MFECFYNISMMKTNEIVYMHTPACHNGRCLRFVRDLPLTVVFVLFFTHKRLSRTPSPPVCLSLSLSVCPSVRPSVSISLSDAPRPPTRLQSSDRKFRSHSIFDRHNYRALFKRNTLKKLAPLFYAPTPTYVWGVENF